MDRILYYREFNKHIQGLEPEAKRNPKKNKKTNTNSTSSVFLKKNSKIKIERSERKTGKHMLKKCNTIKISPDFFKLWHNVLDMLCPAWVQVNILLVERPNKSTISPSVFAYVSTL